MKKSKLCKALAMAVALSGLGVGMYAPTVGAVDLPANALGEVLIFPYYTTRAGWQTTLSFVNTDESNLIAVKFRFYEGYNSRDTLDFNVLMSPGDVFSGVVEEGVNGPQFRRAENDTTCTVPAGQLTFGNSTAKPAVPSGSLLMSAEAFAGVSNVNVFGSNGQRANNDGGPTTVDRLREGYVMAIVMGHWPVPTAATAATYPAGSPEKLLYDTVHDANGINTSAECVAAEQLFVQSVVERVGVAPFGVGGAGTFHGTAQVFGEPINVLRGNYTFLNVARGTSVGGNATALANFMTVTPLATDTATTSSIVTSAGTVGTGSVGIAPRDGLGGRTLCTVTFDKQFNYGTTAPVAWDPNASGAACPNLITAQQPFWFLEPSMNDAYPPIAVIANNVVPPVGPPTLPGAGTVAVTSPGTVQDLGLNINTWRPLYGFQAVSEILRSRAIINEWSINPDLGVRSAWVVTHPTKGFFVDRNTFDSPQAAVNNLRFPSVAGVAASVPPIGVTAALPPFRNIFQGTSPTAGNGKSCNQVGFRLFNRDEVGKVPGVGGVSPSPAQPSPNIELCYEANVIPFDQGNDVFESVLLPSQIANLYAAIESARTADPTMLKPFGWMRLDLDTESTAKLGAGGTTLAGPGLPAVGFMLRERVIPGTGDSYSDISDHSFIR